MQRRNRVVDGLLVRRILQHVLCSGKRLVERLPAIGSVVGLLQLVGCGNGLLKLARVHVKFHQRALRPGQRLQRTGNRFRAFRIHQLLASIRQRFLERLPRLSRIIAAVECLGRVHSGLQRRRINACRADNHAHGHVAAFHIHNNALGRGDLHNHAVHTVDGRVGIALGTRRRVRCARGAWNGNAVAQPLIRHRSILGGRNRCRKLWYGLALGHNHHARLVQRNLRLCARKCGRFRKQRGVAHLNAHRRAIGRNAPVQRIGG